MEGEQMMTELYVFMSKQLIWLNEESGLVWTTVLLHDLISGVCPLTLHLFLKYTSHCVSSNLKHIELQPQESINILFHFTANLSQTLWLHFYFIQTTKEDWTCEDKG